MIPSPILELFKNCLIFSTVPSSHAFFKQLFSMLFAIKFDPDEIETFYFSAPER
jgi:hypothetical protein